MRAACRMPALQRAAAAAPTPGAAASGMPVPAATRPVPNRLFMVKAQAGAAVAIEHDQCGGGGAAWPGWWGRGGAAGGARGIGGGHLLSRRGGRHRQRIKPRGDAAGRFDARQGGAQRLERKAAAGAQAGLGQAARAGTPGSDPPRRRCGSAPGDGQPRIRLHQPLLPPGAAPPPRTLPARAAEDRQTAAGPPPQDHRRRRATPRCRNGRGLPPAPPAIRRAAARRGCAGRTAPRAISGAAAGLSAGAAGEGLEPRREQHRLGDPVAARVEHHAFPRRRARRARGKVTVRAKPAATAASVALPPRAPAPRAPAEAGARFLRCHLPRRSRAAPPSSGPLPSSVGRPLQPPSSSRASAAARGGQRGGSRVGARHAEGSLPWACGRAGAVGHSRVFRPVRRPRARGEGPAYRHPRCRDGGDDPRLHPPLFAAAGVNPAVCASSCCRSGR